MAEDSKIEWTDHTFNPWTGCTKVSPGCDHCYAEGWSKRAGDKAGKWGPGAARVRTTNDYWRQPLKWQRQAAEFFAQHGRRQRVFCASLADVFDNEAPAEWRAALFALIACTPDLDWLLLTKRIGNVAKMIEAPGMQKCGLPSNVWLGATITSQAEADRDIPKLLAVPARVHFLSMEPLLSAVDLKLMQYEDSDDRDELGRIIANTRRRFIKWVIVGGESGPGARPMHPDWARSLRDQCQAAGVPFLFKQWGEYAGDQSTLAPAKVWTMIDRTGRTLQQAGSTANMGPITHVARVGKAKAGRLLDGIEHNRFPQAV